MFILFLLVVINSGYQKKALGLQADLGRQATEMPENPMEADDTAAVAECSRLLGFRVLGLKGLVRVWVGVDCGFLGLGFG